MKLLYVGGDGDYLCQTFEEHFSDKTQEIWDKAMSYSDHKYNFKWYDDFDNGGTFYIEAIEFDVSLEFLQYLRKNNLLENEHKGIVIVS